MFSFFQFQRKRRPIRSSNVIVGTKEIRRDLGFVGESRPSPQLPRLQIGCSRHRRYADRGADYENREVQEVQRKRRRSRQEHGRI